MSSATPPFGGQGYYEPHLTIVKLPRCPNVDCPDPVHPLARAGNLDPSTCPGCGRPAAAPCEEQTVEATFVGEQA